MKIIIQYGFTSYDKEYSAKDAAKQACECNDL